MSNVERKSSVMVVGPSETTANPSLSPYDKLVVGMPVIVLLAFEHQIHEPANTIKRGLSKALVHYHPISGRLATGATADEVHIKCTGEGVSFVTASAKRAMKDVKFFDQPLQAKLLEELAFYPAERCGCTDPLLMMQVTEFSCGGFVVGVTWNHAIADAAGMSQFLKAVGELARGLSSPSVVPVTCDNSLTGIPLSLHSHMNYLLSLQPVDMALLDITVPSILINCIKDKFRGHSNGKPCTVFEAVTAVLWQCRTRAIISDPEAPTMLSFAANARKYVGAKDGYYGNCSTIQKVVATTDAVAKGDVIDVIKMIRRAKDQIADQFKKDADSGIQQVDALLAYSIFHVTCWRNLGLEEVDFGGGGPSRVMYYSQHRKGLPCGVVCPPGEVKDGSNVISLCVKEEHADAFLAELERFT